MKKKFWICNKVDAITAEILLYGFIGEYEAIDDAAFIVDLRNLESQYSNIHFRVNCGGGDVYKGLAIYSAISGSKANTTCYIDGIAASMGAVVAIASKRVEMSKYGRYMTHRVSGFAGGNADDLRNYAEMMEGMEGTISQILAKRTGLPEADCKTKYITNKDRWLRADEALAEKLVDAIYDAEPVAVPENSADEKQLYNAFKTVYNIAKTETPDMKAIALALGLPETATEAEITAAIAKQKADKETAETAVKNAATAQAKSLVDGAINNGQLVEADRAVFQPLAETNYAAAQNAINKIPKAQRPTNLLNRTNLPNEGGTNEETIDTWEKLSNQSDEFIADFKKANLALYNQLHKTYLAQPIK